MNRKPVVSIICPVYNEEQAIPLFYERLTSAVSPLSERYEFELIFTNNRSTDGTLDIIRALREKDLSVQVLTLSRNFGYQASVLAGITHAAGDAIVVIDVDCEDPPEMIPGSSQNGKRDMTLCMVVGRIGRNPDHWCSCESFSTACCG